MRLVAHTCMACLLATGWPAALADQPPARPLVTAAALADLPPAPPFYAAASPADQPPALPLSAATAAIEIPETPANRLSEAGLFRPGSSEPRPEYLSFSPQYPLWSDAARKQRWLYIPPGSSIDASDPDAWVFPPGTRLWKQFALARPVETRLIERLADGSWRYLSYVWDAEGKDAELAPAAGIRSLPAEGSADGFYSIPARDDCRACHEGAATPVLGVGALQLSSDRDPLAPHAEPALPGHADLRELVARGWLVNLPKAFLDRPPRIEAGSPVTRAALGYLHANCGHCHNDNGELDMVDMLLAQRVSGPVAHIRKVLGTLIDQPGDYRAPGLLARIVPGQPDASTLAVRMRSRNPLSQMPPLGTRFMDVEGVALIERWIQYDLPNLKETEK